jgi:hypothetical protein
MFESRIGRIIQRKSPLGDAGGEFRGSLSDYRLLKNDFMGKYKGQLRLQVTSKSQTVNVLIISKT